MYNKKKILLFIRLTLLIIIIICLAHICQTYYLSVKHKHQQEALSTLVMTEETQSQTQQEQLSTKLESTQITEKNKPTSLTQNQTPEIMERFQNLYTQNNDLVGWLTIPETSIDYPVVQCEDNDYYLHHNFYQEEDKYGCLYVKDIADVDTPCTNFIIYGHNMKDGSMFGNLDQYKDQSFCIDNPYITFDTLYEERTYQILAVFLSQVYREDEDVFKYYQFYEARTEAEFRDFYENILEMALYDTGVTAVFGDTFLTLSTCAYHVEDGRFVVVAKRIS